MPLLSLNQETYTLEEMKNADFFPGIDTFKINNDLVSEVVRLEQMNQRHSIAHTKTRAEVSGGGKKPWKQKGTGRARHGSTRSPIWVGGGVAWGPRNTRNWHRKINHNARLSSIKSVLADRYQNSHLVILESANFQKTKESITVLKAFEAQPKRKIAVVYNTLEKDSLNGLRNLEGVDLVNVCSLNVFRMVKKPYLVFTSKAALDLGAKLLPTRSTTEVEIVETKSKIKSTTTKKVSAKKVTKSKKVTETQI